MRSVSALPGIYTSDHGDYASEFGLLEKAPGICGDAVCRIPAIWSWPGRFAAGHISDAIVETVDVAPTLCGLAGLPPMPTADGVNITPLLEARPATLHRIGVTEHPWSKAVLKGAWRLVYYPGEFFGGEEFGELYDLATDPWEMHNLYFDPAHRAKVAELQRDLLDWLVTTTRVKTMLPMAGADHFHQHREADDKLSWRNVATQNNLNYR